MNEKTKNIVTVCLMSVVVLALSLLCFFGEDNEFSESERRVLKSFPELSWDTVISGDFMAEFETYTQDQFPARESFRTVKSLCAYYAFARLDSNGIYLRGDHVSKLDYPLSTPMLDYAAQKFDYLYSTYLRDSGCKVYLSVVPDKNYFLTRDSIYLSYNYEDMISDFCRRADYMTYIDITDTLSIDDYYRTDSHWKQENIVDTARTLAAGMGVGLTGEYTVRTLDTPFYGVYKGQSALPLEPDTLRYLTNDVLENCIVTSYDTGAAKPAQLYDLEAARGRDPYEMFLCGANALLTIENPSAETDRELYVFRDSFGSSIIPLLCEGYSKITVIDIRYVRSDMLGALVDFTGGDVLFLYSTAILNSSTALR